MEVLPDSSTIIALVKTGSLDLLRKIFDKIWITEEVRGEITVGGYPEAVKIKRGMDQWIKSLKDNKTEYQEFESIGGGERSMLSYAKGKEDVLLILDESEARAIAKGEGIPYTGTMGLIIFAYENKSISKNEAIGIVRRLSQSDFRMTVELYDWALDRLK